jgi:hypothetical protein
MFQNIMDAGREYLSSPQKGRQYIEDSTSHNDLMDNEGYSAPSAPVDNMSLLHSAMQQQLQPAAPSVTADIPSDAARYRLFCLEAGIIGTTSDYYVWLREQGGLPVTATSIAVQQLETPASNTGKLVISRLANSGILSLPFVKMKLLCGFNKPILIESTAYDVYVHTHHSAGMESMSSETIWACLTINGITTDMCNELVKAQFTARVLDYEDPERPILAVMKFFEVTMTPAAVFGLQSLTQTIRSTDTSKGYGALFRLQCFLHLVHRLSQDALHGTHTTLNTTAFEDGIEDEIVSNTLTTAYFAVAKDSRLRIKDAETALLFQTLTARIDRYERPAKLSPPPAKQKERRDPPAASALPSRESEVCLPFMRDPSLCATPCTHGRLHAWPSSMPIKSKRWLMARAAKLPLPASVVPPSGGSATGSQRSPRPPRRATSSSAASVTSSISSADDDV